MATDKKKGTSRRRTTGGRRKKDTKGAALEKSELIPSDTGLEASEPYLEGGGERKTEEGRTNEEVRGESETETREGPFGEGMPPRTRPDRGYGAHPGQSDAI